MLLVDRLNPTLPAYEFCEVTVTVDVPDLPWATVTFVADIENVPLPEPPPDPPTFTVTEPVDAAKVESPEYSPSITCAPAAVEENVYVAEPFDRASELVSVVPSTTIVNDPLGVVLIELDSGATVMVMVSFAPEDGVLVAAVSAVMVGFNDDPEPVQAFIRLYKSIEPRPVASSYPVVAAYFEAPEDEQY